MIPNAWSGTHYLEFLPTLAKRRNVNRYLEVGVNNGDMLRRVQAQKAIGVDPMFTITQNVVSGKGELLLVQETSDDFFADKTRLSAFFNGPIDLSFLDGMHRFEYLLRDFIHAEACSSEKSCIVFHDCLPLDGNMIHREQTVSDRLTAAAGKNVGWWTGDVYKVLLILKKYRPDLRISCIDCEPTGLVCIDQLDPSSSVLKNDYASIEGEAARWSNDESFLGKMYDDIDVLGAAKILDGSVRSTLIPA